MSNFDDYFAEHQQIFLNKLMDYCRLPSVTITGEAIGSTTQFVESLLQKSGFSTRQLLVDGAPPYIYAEQIGSSPYTLLLYNHYDVQPEGDVSKWKSSPFLPDIQADKIYARGIADNKGEFIARLMAIAALREMTGELPLTIRWIIEGEEETGTPHFDNFLKRYSELCQADGCLWEGVGFTNNGRSELCLGKKGLLYIRLQTQKLTADAHSGLAGIMPSAAWHLINALHSIRRPDGKVLIDGFYDDIVPPSSAQITAVSDQPDYGADYESRLHHSSFVDGLTGQALREQLFFEPTCNIAGLSSGFSGDGIMTIVPARAQADLDFRLVPNQDPNKVVRALRTHLVEHGFEDIEMEVKTAVFPVAMDIEMPFARAVEHILTSTFGQAPSIVPISEKTLPLVSILKKHLNIPGLGAPTNPIYPGSNQHAPNEHIRIKDFKRAVKVSFQLFSRLASIRS